MVVASHDERAGRIMTARPDLTREQTPARPRVAMALYGDLTHDSRVIREAETLAGGGWAVRVYSLAGSPPAGSSVESVAVLPDGASVLPDGSSPFLRASTGSRLARLRARVTWAVGYARTLRAWGRTIVAAEGEVDMWHVHDLTGLLAVGPLVRSPIRLVYDSHEVFLESGTATRLPATLRRALQKYERHLTHKAEALVTVSDSTAAVLGRRLGPAEVVIVRNCPPRWTPAEDDPLRLRAALQLAPDDPIALYHGGFIPGRGIEQFSEALLEPGVERVHGALLGFGPMRDQLRAMAAEERFGGRLHVLDAVPPDELLGWVSGADVNVIPVQPSSFNNRIGSPNKLWEALAAGVPVVVSDFPELRRVVLEDPQLPLGATCDPTSRPSIAAAIRAIVEQPAEERAALRRRCQDAARRRWNWETEGDKLLALYRALLPVGPGRGVS
jgi:glycosyltransferase involved in cell wall biosynthesis